MKLRVLQHHGLHPEISILVEYAVQYMVHKQLTDGAMMHICTWKPAGISYGRQISTSYVDINQLRKDGYEICRRPTGGGAVWVGPGVCSYSLIVPRPYKGINSSARLFCHFNDIARKMFMQMGLTVDPAVKSLGREVGTPDCFADHTKCELLSDERKVHAASFIKGYASYYHHGQIPIDNQFRVIEKYLRQPERARPVTPISLQDLGINVTMEEMCSILTDACRYEFEVEESELTQEEWMLVSQQMQHFRQIRIDD